MLAQFLLNQLGYRARVAIVPPRKPGWRSLLRAQRPALQCYLRGYKPRSTLLRRRSQEALLVLHVPHRGPAAKGKIDMNVASTPIFRVPNHVSTRKGTGKSADIMVSTVVPEQLISYYKSIPQCDYSVYANAAVAPASREMVLAALRPAIAGKSETEAAALLLDYVQHAFEYATDGDQFGYEKPFFVEELYYYPKCDCEDRSVFYRFLVRELLGLDVVLLEVPNHLATAVRFSTPPGGDCVQVGSTAYTPLCDPPPT